MNTFINKTINRWQVVVLVALLAGGASFFINTHHANAAVNNYYVSASGSGAACTSSSPCSISQAISSFTLGTNGAVIHVADVVNGTPRLWFYLLLRLCSR